MTALKTQNKLSLLFQLTDWLIARSKNSSRGVIAIPLILWLIGVPGLLVLLLWFFFFRGR